MVGIYLIKNIFNDKTYVGQSSDIHGRFRRHISALSSHEHANKYLQADWDKYGEEAFEFSILEECQEDELNDREKYYILVTNSFSLGYNMNIGGDGIRGYKHSPDEINKMRHIQKPLAVLQFDQNFNLIRRWDGGVSHIVKTLHYTHACILLRCRHTLNGIMTPYKDCYWIYEDEFNQDSFTWDKYLQNISVITLGDKLTLNCDKTICQYSLDGKLLHEWNNCAELLDAGFDISRIRLICNHSGRIKTHKGFKWQYK